MSNRRGMFVLLKALPHALGVPTPSYGSDMAAGLDLRAAIPAGVPWGVSPGAVIRIPTGFCGAIPPEHAGLVLSRSGMAVNKQLCVVNAPGLIDPDYTGEWIVALENRGKEDQFIYRNERIAQLVIVPAPSIQFAIVDDLLSTARGAGGIGSTGL